jgi:hypothetical protein
MAMTTNEVDAGAVRETAVSEDAAKGRARQRNAPPPAGGAVYGLGMIGALVYFLRTADSREDYILAVGKAVVWPAILVYLALRSLGA